MNNKIIKKGDYIIILVVLLISFSGIMLEAKLIPKGDVVTISVDNKIYGRYKLNDNRSIVVQGVDGSNTVVINDGFVYVAEADCKNQICVKSSKISSPGQSIICLPHRMVVTISGQNKDVDVYSN